MVRFNVRLMRGPKHVTLQMLEGRPLVKGVWRRVEDESNSTLTCEEGTWENWVLGSPGGVRNIRLYDPSGVTAAILMDFLAGTTDGDGIMVRPDFGGPFGDGDFRWAQILNLSAGELDEDSRTTNMSPSRDSASPSAA
jgi:hypothetical protein